jgi:hypothetical protein
MRLEWIDEGPLVFRHPFGEGEHCQAHVRAASAIVPFAGGWLVAQDDTNFAAAWGPGGIDPIRLFPDVVGDTYSSKLGNKQHKPDLECGVTIPVRGAEAAVLFGSGSTRARRRAAVVTPPHGVRIARLDSLYAAAMEVMGVGEDELNLEGACALGGTVRFYQRGNAGPRARNVTFEVATERLVEALDGGTLTPADLSNVRDHALGTLGGAPLGFSAAAALPDGLSFFAASAEASPNTYDDGPCEGSVIGCMDPEGTIVEVQPLPAGAPQGQKIEGLAVESWHEHGGRLLAVTDNDDPTAPARWLRVAFSWAIRGYS